MPPRTIRWDADPHTLAKHAILRKYLGGWMPKLMLGGHGRVLFIDAFAGPGEYKGGEEGSPIIALRTLLDHRERDRMLARAQMVFLFTDARADRIKYLDQVALPKVPIPAAIDKRVIIGTETTTFEEGIGGLLDSLEQGGHRMAPAFAFVDPFGFSGTPMSLLHRILGQRRSEVMVTVMLEWVNRFLSHPDPAVAARYDELFGTDTWRKLLKVPNRLTALGNLYEEQLRLKAEFVWSFRMLDDGNRPIYDLFFASNHIEGLKQMKRALWSVDPIAGARFSDRVAMASGDQPTMFTPEVDTSPLQRALLRQFSQRLVPYDEVERWVLTDTPFHDTHIKTRTLRPMEERDEIEYEAPAGRTAPRRGLTYPTGCSIRFE
jgi:three-Cys-motif partner protein